MMGWVYLDDTFPEHDKVIKAGGDAILIWIYGLAYCNRRLTEGRIPKAYVPQLTDRKRPMDLAAKLVDVGLWIDKGDYFEVHEYSRWNHSAVAKAKAKKAANARWNGHAQADAHDDAQASGEHVPEEKPDVMLGDASRAPGPLIPSSPVVTSTHNHQSVELPIGAESETQTVEGRLIDRLVSVCTLPAGKSRPEAAVVIPMCLKHVDQKIVDEAIGICGQLEQPPKFPRYLFDVAADTAARYKVPMPRLQLPKRAS